jgi:hypothetical protein
VLFVGSAVVNVGEADVLRAGVDAADVCVSVFVDGFEPIEVFSEENVGFNEDASSFVEDMEHDQSPPYGFEVVFEIVLGLCPHSLLQFAERFFDFEDGGVRKVGFEVASVDHGQLKQGQSREVSHVFNAAPHEKRLFFHIVDVRPYELRNNVFGDSIEFSHVNWKPIFSGRCNRGYFGGFLIILFIVFIKDLK